MPKSPSRWASKGNLVPLQLNPLRMRQLRKAGTPAPGFGDDLIAGPIQRMVLGGHDLRGYAKG